MRLFSHYWMVKVRTFVGRVLVASDRPTYESIGGGRPRMDIRRGPMYAIGG